MISVSENSLVESWRFALQNKICPFLRQGNYIYIDNFFFSENVSMLLQEERGLDCMYSKKSLEISRIHIWFTPLLE